MTKTRLTILSSLLALSTACGTSDSEDGAIMSLSLAMTSGSSLSVDTDKSTKGMDNGGSSEGKSSEPLVATSQDGYELTIESAHVFVRHIELDLPDGASCDDDLEDESDDDSDDDSDDEKSTVCEDDKIKLEGPWVFDLVTGEATPSLDEVVVPAGVYKRIDVRLDDADDNLPEGALAELEDLTMIVSGTYSGPGADRFEIALKFNEDARFETEDGIEIMGGSVTEFPLRLDVSGWLKDLPLGECLDDDDIDVKDGVLQLTDGSGSCSDIENHLKDQIKNSGQFD